MMKNIIVLLISVLFISGCGGKSDSSKDTAALSKRSSLINRTFEDLTLGMSKDELESKLVYFGPSSRPGTPYEEYMVYSVYYNVNLANDNPRWGEIRPKMKEVENIFAAYCDFFEHKLFRISVKYRNNYQPTWDSFIYNAKQKYGKGKEAVDKIRWNDGKTTLIIQREYGDQLSAPSLGISDYGEHYVVTYIDNEIISRMDKKEKEEAPKF